MLTDLQKEEMLYNLSNKKTEIVLYDNKVCIQDLVEEIRNDNPKEFEPPERMTGIQKKEDIDRRKREVPRVLHQERQGGQRICEQPQ